MSRIIKAEHDAINKTLHFILRFCVLESVGITKTSTKNKRLCRIVKVTNQLRNLMDDQFFNDYPSSTAEESPYYGKNNDKYHKISLSEFELS